MGKVNRLKVQNSLTKRIVITIFSVTITIILIYIGFSITYKNMSSLAFDLGEKSQLKEYEDVILTSYDEYAKLMNDLKIDKTLSKENFNQNYYIASFQEYDPCAEKKYKEVIDIKYEDKIVIKYMIHNKCGWCRAHTALHLIKIDQIKKDVEYEYEYSKELSCGTVN